MEPKIALKNMCKHCQELMSQIPSKAKPEDADIHHCGHIMCPFRVIDNEYCPDYDSVKAALDEFKQNKLKYEQVVTAFKILSKKNHKARPIEVVTTGPLNNCYCPSCKDILGNSIDARKLQYCPMCGQKLDWEEEDDKRNNNN